MNPEQMRALAGFLEGIEDALPTNTGVHIIVARDTLRAAADQLEAVQAICDRALSVKLAGPTSADTAAAAIASAVKNAIITADTAPQEDRDD